MAGKVDAYFPACGLSCWNVVLSELIKISLEMTKLILAYRITKTPTISLYDRQAYTTDQLPNDVLVRDSEVGSRTIPIYRRV